MELLRELIQLNEDRDLLKQLMPNVTDDHFLKWTKKCAEIDPDCELGGGAASRIIIAYDSTGAVIGSYDLKNKQNWTADPPPPKQLKPLTSKDLMPLLKNSEYKHWELECKKYDPQAEFEEGAKVVYCFKHGRGMDADTWEEFMSDRALIGVFDVKQMKGTLTYRKGAQTEISLKKLMPDLYKEKK